MMGAASKMPNPSLKWKDLAIQKLNRRGNSIFGETRAALPSFPKTLPHYVEYRYKCSRPSGGGGALRYEPFATGFWGPRLPDFYSRKTLLPVLLTTFTSPESLPAVSTRYKMPNKIY